MPTGKMDAEEYIARLREARSRPSVLKIRWLNFNQGKRHRRILVVEGKEDKIVYDQWLRRIQFGMGHEFFVAGGKRNVLTVRDFVDRADFEIYFLVDQDFDDNGALDDDEAVYVLPRYSIENYLVCGNILSECLQTAFDLDGHPEVREEICDIFEKDYCDFLEVSKEWNRRIFFARRLGINIDDEMPSSLDVIAEVNVGNVGPGNGSPEVIFAKVPMSQENMNIFNPIFEAMEPRFSYRGKFALKFLRIWLMALLAELKDTDSDVVTVPAGCAVKADQGEFALGVLAGRSTIPEGLSEFFRS